MWDDSIIENKAGRRNSLCQKSETASQYEAARVGNHFGDTLHSGCRWSSEDVGSWRRSLSPVPAEWSGLLKRPRVRPSTFNGSVWLFTIRGREYIIFAKS